MSRLHFKNSFVVTTVTENWSQQLQVYPSSWYILWRHIGKSVTSRDWCDCHRRTDHPADLIMFSRVNSVYSVTNKTNSNWLKIFTTVLSIWTDARYPVLILRCYKQMFVCVWERSIGKDQTFQIDNNNVLNTKSLTQYLSRVHHWLKFNLQFQNDIIK